MARERVQLPQFCVRRCTDQCFHIFWQNLRRITKWVRKYIFWRETSVKGKRIFLVVNEATSTRYHVVVLKRFSVWNNNILTCLSLLASRKWKNVAEAVYTVNLVDEEDKFRAFSVKKFTSFEDFERSAFPAPHHVVKYFSLISLTRCTGFPLLTALTVRQWLSKSHHTVWKL